MILTRLQPPVDRAAAGGLQEGVDLRKRAAAEEAGRPHQLEAGAVGDRAPAESDGRQDQSQIQDHASAHVAAAGRRDLQGAQSGPQGSDSGRADFRTGQGGGRKAVCGHS